jgi:hypothetical protein
MRKKICPLRMIGMNIEDKEILKSNAYCLQEYCQWWHIYYKGAENEFGECGIMAVTGIMDGV